MAYITGLILIDVPAGALNNGQGDDTKSRVKNIRVTGQGDYPYVSAQSFRFWLRETMQKYFPEMEPSPVYTAGKGKKQQAFTKGDPITYWDDDLLGYMRAEKAETVTRVSPFRTGTLVSLTPVRLVDDFGVMARAKKEEGDKEGVLLHGHEFYRTVLQLPFSLDLSRAGTFTDERRTGYKNLGKETLQLADEQGLAYLDAHSAYRMDIKMRIKRVQALLGALGRVEGGAKQTLHYTDVTPAFVIASVTKGGNHIFGRAVKAASDSRPAVHEAAMRQVLTVFEEEILSPLYIGRAEGFMDADDALLQEFGDVAHPREALDALADDLGDHPEWLE